MTELILNDFKIDKNEPEEGIKELLKIIKPTWNSDNLQLKPLTGGNSSKIFRCCDEANPEDAVTVRIRMRIEQYQGFRGKERQAIEHFSKVGHFPKIKAIFSNGYCYDYIKGKPMIHANGQQIKGVINDKMLRMIAKELVFIHSQRIEGLVYEKSEIVYFEDTMFARPFLAVHEKAPTNEVAQNELKMVHKFLEALNTPITLKHNDAHPGNIVWNEHEEKLTYVDWEGATIGYQFREVAQFVTSLKLLSFLFNSPEEVKIVLPTDYENKFIRYYFEALMEIQKESFTEDKFLEFKETINKFKLITFLTMMGPPLTMPEMCAKFSGDLNKYIEFAISNYLKIKKEVLRRDCFDVPASEKS